MIPMDELEIELSNFGEIPDCLLKSRGCHKDAQPFFFFTKAATL